MRYKILSPATFGPGTLLGLTPEQAEARAYAIDPVSKGLYRSRLPVQFKAGETINYDGEMPKAMAELVEKAGRAAKAEKPAGSLGGDPPAAGGAGGNPGDTSEGGGAPT